MPRKQAKNVTLICVAGVQIHKAILALLISSFKVNFEKVILVTPHLKPLHRGKFYVERPLDSNLESLIEYNKYILYKLFYHVETQHCLLIQADGFVVNGSMWREEFCAYDYIGAPWPLEEKRYVDPWGNHQRVGNGGFSLRSKKLLQVPQKVEIPWEVNQGSFYKHFDQGAYSEDGNICVHNRHIFEQQGCKFAPLEVAILFSRELDLPDCEFGKTLGFHRYKRKKVKNIVKKYKLKWHVSKR